MAHLVRSGGPESTADHPEPRELFIAKAYFYDWHRARLNDRQAKAIARMFRQGPDGIKGGLSAETYISITGTSRATAIRDLQDLVEIGAITYR